MNASFSTPFKKIFLRSLAALSGLLVISCRTMQDTQTIQENLIVKENRQEGTTSWLIDVPLKRCDLPDHQNCRRPEIEGYCSKTRYYAGDTLEIFVSTAPASDYTLDIFRMGYYGGKGGRLMKAAGEFSGPEAPDHAMVMYTAAKGNYVFNAGTCFWSLPLSSPPGYQSPVNNQGELGKDVLDFTKEDPRIQRIMKNLLERAVKGK